MMNEHENNGSNRFNVFSSRITARLNLFKKIRDGQLSAYNEICRKENEQACLNQKIPKKNPNAHFHPEFLPDIRPDKKHLLEAALGLTNLYVDRLTLIEACFQACGAPTNEESFANEVLSNRKLQDFLHYPSGLLPQLSCFQTPPPKKQSFLFRDWPYEEPTKQEQRLLYILEVIKTQSHDVLYYERIITCLRVLTAYGIDFCCPGLHELTVLLKKYYADRPEAMELLSQVTG